jgi:putative iron-dependent peroxidase
MKEFPVYSGPGFDVPSTPGSLWLWLRGNDAGEIYLRSRKLQHILAPAFQLDSAINAFRYDVGRDLSGYEDGTENPQGDDALKAAFVSNQGSGLDGSSFVAVQKWVHNFDLFNAMDAQQRDNTIGRRISDNAEIDDAPESAHVKRTAQEDFSPEAFVLRRSMPWNGAHQAGLIFVAFGASFYAYEALLNRMTGNEDGIPDALFRFTHPVDGSYYWCPPMKGGSPDLSALGL